MGCRNVWRRRFSQQIRLVLAKSDGLAEARSLCAAQMDEAHTLLADDEAFRAEYMRLWEAQRKHPISPYSASLHPFPTWPVCCQSAGNQFLTNILKVRHAAEAFEM